MPIDAQTVFYSMWASVTLMGACLAIGVGFKRSSLRPWTAAMIWQSLGWGLMSASTWWPAHQSLISNMGGAALVASISAMYFTATHFLARRCFRVWVYLPPAVALLVVDADYFGELSGLPMTNLLIGIQTSWLACMLLPTRRGEFEQRWRWLAFAACALFGFTTIVSTLGLIFEPQLTRTLLTPHWVDVVGLAVNNAWPTICTLAFLLAYRDESERAIKRLALQDALTGLVNRRALMELGGDQLALASRHGQPFAVLMLDIDHFKRINDTFGHQAGDAVLVSFATILQNAVRQSDIVGRYGGEEFCILLPMSTTADAASLDLRLRDQLRTASVTGRSDKFDFSAGAVQAGRDDGATLFDLIGRADQALYAAKAAGRGRLVVESALLSDTPARSREENSGPTADGRAIGGLSR